jgi:hypothetical protein
VSAPAIQVRVAGVQRAAQTRRQDARAAGRGIPRELSEAERQFLNGLGARRELSPKQEKWLSDLERRYHVERVA